MTKNEAMGIIANLHRRWKAAKTKASFIEYCIALGYSEEGIQKLLDLTEEQ